MKTACSTGAGRLMTTPTPRPASWRSVSLRRSAPTPRGAQRSSSPGCTTWSRIHSGRPTAPRAPSWTARGLVQRRRRRRRASPWNEPFAHAIVPNDVWCIDFKGWFRTGDGTRVDPLTVQDAASRYLIACQGLERPTGPETRRALARAFQEYGLPQAIRTDNGPPFAGVGLGSLSPLSAWWIKLGIVPERIEPGHPEQNGRLERLHRTLKAETASPPRANRRRQRRAFDHFRHSYNNERPHEALGQRPPVRLYTPSFRPYPSRLSSPEYGAEVTVRRVRHNGEISGGGQSLCERVSSGRAHRPRPARRAHLVDTVRTPPHRRPRRPRAADRQDPVHVLPMSPV